MKSRETVLAKVWQNPPTSKRYVPAAEIAVAKAKFEDGHTWRVYDQVEGRFVEPDEIERIDPDELMRLP